MMYKLVVFVLTLVVSIVLCAPTEGSDGFELERRGGYTGKATWFHPNRGHCGKKNNDNDLIIAIPTSMYYKSNRCGQSVRIKANGRTVIAKVADSCPPCGQKDIDVSPAVFKSLGVSLKKGVQKVSWEFIGKKARELDEVEADDTLDLPQE